jgi:cell filamentation protein, protein adenylyltransferase
MWFGHIVGLGPYQTMIESKRGRPARRTVHSAVDRAMDELRSIGGLPKPAVSRDIWADIWYEESHNSTAIEGNTLLLKEVRELLGRGHVVGRKALADYLEVRGYADAADWVYAQAADQSVERHEPFITLTELREIHRQVVEAAWNVAPPDGLLPDEGPGSFRRHDIARFPGGMAPPPFVDVPPRVSDWLRDANATPPRERPLIEHLACLHARFEQIHPFRDGNGRTGRLATNLLLVRHGLAPAIIYKRDRARYLRALDRADRGDCGAIGELFARAVKDCIDRFLLPALGGSHQVLQISALSRPAVSALALRRAAERGRLRAVKQGMGWYSTKSWVDAYLDTRKGGTGRRTPRGRS